MCVEVGLFAYCFHSLFVVEILPLMVVLSGVGRFACAIQSPSGVHFEHQLIPDTCFLLTEFYLKLLNENVNMFQQVVHVP